MAIWIECIVVTPVCFSLECLNTYLGGMDLRPTAGF